MKVNVQEVSAAGKRLEITVPASVVKSRLEEQMQKVIREARIRGFRPGKAPRSVIEKYYGEAVQNQVAAEIMEEFSKSAIEKENLKPVAHPVVEPGVLEPGKDFSFVANIEIFPPVELGEYKGVDVQREKAKVTDKDVDKALDDLRKRSAQIKRPEPARPAKKGDVLLLDMTADSKGVTISHEENFQVEIGSGMMPDQFEKALIGHNTGDKGEVDVSYPKEDNHALSGQEVHFAYTVKEVQEKILPDLDDEFAADMGRENLEDLKNHMKERLLEARQEVIDRNARNDILKTLRETHPLDLPPTIVAEQRKSLVDELTRQFRASNLPFHESQFEKELEEKAVEKVHNDLLINAIADKEKIDPTDEEINARIREIADARGQNFEKLRDTLAARGGIDMIKYQLRDAQTLDFLLDHANIIEGKTAQKPAPKPKTAAQKKPAAKGKKREK